MMILHANLLVFASFAFGVEAKRIWANEPADPQNNMMTAYPVGNGYLGAMPLGIPGQDILIMNEHTLWSGGLFESPDYIGGNPLSPVYSALPGMRQQLWETGYTDVSPLFGPPDDYYYGAYQTVGNITVSMHGVTQYSSYTRSLDLGDAIHQTTFTANNETFTTTTFCTYPDEVCVYYLESSAALPVVTVGLEDNLRTNPASNLSCDANGVHLRGQTQVDIGMIFDARVQAVAPQGASCAPSGELLIPSDGKTRSVTVIFSAGTDYDQKHGNTASNFSFKGVDPEAAVLSKVQAASNKSYEEIYNAHVKDYGDLFNGFILNLPNPKNSDKVPTAQLISEYTTDAGDPFVESLLFDYSRYLFIAASRPGTLPPSLLGLWTEQLSPPWNGDYHPDLNLQMTYWHVEQSGLGEIAQPLFDFITDIWVPRGQQTAYLLYDAPGFVGFTTLNIFGFTGMQDAAWWADYPASAAWQLKQAWDRYDYGRDEEWYKSVGYPLLKQVAEYWIHELVPDEWHKDGTLVVGPCNSPEMGYITFGCNHYQQVVWEIFDHIIASWDVTGDTNTTFLQTVKDTQEKMDKGIHIGKYNQLQEYKLDIDDPSFEHRHLSHLAGWYPGYSLGIHSGNKTVTDAINVTLTQRGNGTVDYNTGWEKVWRVSCYAMLNNTDLAYLELKYTIDMNFAGNGLSVYTTCCYPYEPALPFQIDANYGIGAAMLSMLVTDLPDPAASTATTHTVLLGPAIPSAWAGGSVESLRLRGGGMVDFSWDDNGLVTTAKLHGRSSNAKAISIVNKAGNLLASQH